MRGVGSCLFYSISYHVYGTEMLGDEVRWEIVNFVCENFENYRCLSDFLYYKDYFDEMSRPHSFGTSLELKAAADLYKFRFEVFENQTLIAQFGEPIEGVARLLFSGPRNEGHFDVLVPILLPVQSVVESSTLCNKIKRRARYTNLKRIKQHRFSAIMFNKKNPTVNKIARKIYRQNMPSVHRSAVKKYNQSKPSVHRRSVKKYNQNNPIVNRTAVKKYSQSNPGVHRRAVKKYNQNNKSVNRTAVKKYRQKEPSVHRRAVNKYSLKKPSVNIRSVLKYSKNILEAKKITWQSKNKSAFTYDSKILYELDEFVNIGGMSNVCKWCCAKKWKDESVGLCCSSGKVFIRPLQQPPEPLFSLLRNEHPESNHFMEKSRKYNSSFQMTSFGGKEIREGNFMPSFKVQGQVYHLIGSLLPQPGIRPKFLQMYFVGDDDKEANIRCDTAPTLKRNLIAQLQDMLHTTNLYVNFLKAAIGSIQDERDFHIVINSENKPSTGHKGRYNAPAVNEMAAIVVGDIQEERDIVLKRCDGKLQRISILHRAYDTLQYPLMFPYGEDGYSIDIKQVNPQSGEAVQKTVSASQFYAFKIMERNEHINYLLRFRNLFNQFLVDMYAKIEGERLQFIRTNQKKLRVENYVHLQDAIKKADAVVQNIGKIVLLPSTFTGGPRYLHERTQDAMTYVRYYGRPDLFITFTCNPKWTEISEQLADGQKSYHRHDLIARVFHIKVKKMINIITKGNIFGESRCHMFTVEWQKRGLPHVHILLWLKKRISPNDIDKVINAEIPNREADPKLYDIVKANMIHGPCGVFNKKSPCVVNGSCSKHYPRDLLKNTQTGQDGYPNYKRRSPDDGGFTCKINGMELDNRWLVPYNPVLLRSFNAHINVEFCNSVKCVKYICKYINKGSDQATFAVKNDMDEVPMKLAAILAVQRRHGESCVFRFMKDFHQ